MNLVMLIGNIGKEPETFDFPTGNNATKLSLATNESYKDKNGEWQQTTEWHNVVAWGNLGDLAAKYSKGDMILVEGKISTRSYEDNSGTKRYITEVIARKLKNLSPKPKDQSHQRPKEPHSIFQDVEEIKEDDLPF